MFGPFGRVLAGFLYKHPLQNSLCSAKPSQYLFEMMRFFVGITSAAPFNVEGNALEVGLRPLRSGLALTEYFNIEGAAAPIPSDT